MRPPARRIFPVVLVLLGAAVLHAQPIPAAPPSPTAPATQPQPDAQAWSPSAFAYNRTEPLSYVETTPQRAQVNWRNRPPVLPTSPADLNSTATTPPRPLAVGTMRITHLKFRSVNGDVVPALLAVPANRTGPFPVVIAIHGRGSHKAQVLAQVGPALSRRGFAVLAPDMPHHGERPGDLEELFNVRKVMETVALYREAVINVRECIDLAEQHPMLDTSEGVYLAGYSMGSWINSVAGPADQRVAAMVLMVGGAVPAGPLLVLVPQATAVDPMRALPHFAGRPVLMLNAERDRIVTPEMGNRLFEAAAEPKAQKWYPSGHILPRQAYDDAAAWLATVRQDIANRRTPANQGNETGPPAIKALP